MSDPVVTQSKDPHFSHVITSYVPPPPLSCISSNDYVQQEVGVEERKEHSLLRT